MSSDDEKKRHRARRQKARSVHAQSLELRQFRQRRIPGKTKEDKLQRRAKRYRTYYEDDDGS